MPEVFFDKEQRRNYHLAEGRRVWHEVPSGFELDEEGKPQSTGEMHQSAASGGFEACAEKPVLMSFPAGGFETIETPAEEPEEEPVAPAEVKKHGRSNRGA